MDKVLGIGILISRISSFYFFVCFLTDVSYYVSKENSVSKERR